MPVVDVVTGDEGDRLTVDVVVVVVVIGGGGGGVGAVVDIVEVVSVLRS